MVYVDKYYREYNAQMLPDLQTEEIAPNFTNKEYELNTNEEEHSNK